MERASETIAPIEVEYGPVSKRAIVPRARRPSAMARESGSMPRPKGVTAPAPAIHATSHDGILNCPDDANDDSSDRDEYTSGRNKDAGEGTSGNDEQAAAE